MNAEKDCPFEDRRMRYNPPNAVSAMCVQVHDDLKLVNALANVGSMDEAARQIKIIQQRLDFALQRITAGGRADIPA